jgi:hypothetical protein
VTASLAPVGTRRVPFVPGGSMHGVRRADRISLVALGDDNVDTRWVDLRRDGSVAGPFALPFAMEAVTAHGESLVLSGNEPGSDEPIILTVDAEGIVTNRQVVDAGTLTRWPVPIVTEAGVTLVWESTDGLFWSEPPEPPRRFAGPGETNALALVAATEGEPALVARSTVAGDVEVWTPGPGSWQRIDLAGRIESVAAISTDAGWAIAGAHRGERTLAVAVLDPDLATRAFVTIEPPGTGPLMSSSVRIAAAGSRLVLGWSERSRVRAPRGEPSSASRQIVTVVDADALADSADASWTSLDPAGALHHAIVGDGVDRVVVVHGDDDAYATEFRIDP